MDSLTHIVLGACIGEALAGKRLGKKALLIGAIANSLPDIDVIAAAWLPSTADLLAHRGFTHSFLFTIIISPLLALLSVKWLDRKGSMTFGQWTLFWGLELFIHQFIDAFNAYGTGWFEPFSHYRVSFNTMFVADPLFTIWPIIATIALIILNKNNGKRKQLAGVAISLSALYLLLGISFKLYADGAVKKDLAVKGITFNHYFSTPTPLNNLLWYVVAANDSGYYTGYRSVLDKSVDVKLHYTYRNDSLLKFAANKSDIDYLVRFSKGFYSASMLHDTAIFNDLRFGEINGWDDSVSRFVFYYYLQYPDANNLIVQRGRLAKWDKQTIGLFLKRIGGIDN
jgi:inner membrane protein